MTLPRQINDNKMGHLRGKSGDADAKESELEPSEVWQHGKRPWNIIGSLITQPPAFSVDSRLV